MWNLSNYNTFEKNSKIDSKEGGFKGKKEGEVEDFASRNAEAARNINILKNEVRAILKARSKERLQSKYKK